MRVSLTMSNGANDYWRFAWLRHPNQWILEVHSPAKHPSRKLEFLRLQEESKPEVYYPLEEVPGISRRFAGLNDAQGVLAFANTFGPLGLYGVDRDRKSTRLN